MRRFVALIVCLALPVAAMYGSDNSAAGGTESPRVRIEKEITRLGKPFVFRRIPGPSRLKLFNEQQYYAPTEGEIFNLLKIEDRWYGVTACGKLVEEHWENKQNFASRFVPLPEFVKQLDGQIADTEGKLKEIGEKIKKNNEAIKKNRQAVKILDKEINHYGGQNKCRLKTLENRRFALLRGIRQLEKELKDDNTLLTKTTGGLAELRKQRQKYPAQSTKK